MIRSAKLAATLILLLVLAVGCSPDNVSPKEKQDAPSLLSTSYNGHHRPDTQCGPSVSHNIVDENRAVIGSVEMLNDNRNVYMLFTLNHGWLLSDLKMYTGDANSIPKGNNGLAMEEFPAHYVLDQISTNSTFKVPLSTINSCTDFAVYARAKQLNFFGNEVAQTSAWVEGTPVLDGQYFNFCSATCSNSSNISVNDISQ